MRVGLKPTVAQAPQGGTVLDEVMGWEGCGSELVPQNWLLRFHFLLESAALILSPCRHMFRSWPEESATHWGGSDQPSEGGAAGGGTAGGGLPLDFQHRSVRDGMSDRSPPPPPTLKAALRNSNPAVSQSVDKMY